MGSRAGNLWAGAAKIGNGLVAKGADAQPVGDVVLSEVIVGTGGAYQGVGIPRYGYLRVELDDDTHALTRCFVEVPPVGYAEPPNEPPSQSLPHCPAQ